MVPVLQMVPIILNAVLALPILVLISNSEPRVLSTTLLRYGKLSTSYSAVELTFKLAWLLVLAFNTLIFFVLIIRPVSAALLST